MPYRTGDNHPQWKGGVTKDRLYKNKYRNEWKKRQKATGRYGKCGQCKVNLSIGNKSGFCKACAYGINHPNYKGGYINAQGYRVINLGGKQTMLEHRYVMEQYIGRKLYKDEYVHHINGVKEDNRLENLELWSTSHPQGQRIADKVKWAKEILELYT